MSWDRPSVIQDGAKTSDAIKVATDLTPARADSSAFGKPVSVEVPLIMRALGLAAPGSWVLLTAALWWAWRAVALYARGELGSTPAQNTVLAWGLFADLVMIHLVFALARTVQVAATAAADPRHIYVVVIKRAVFGLFFASTLLRILDVVQSSMVGHPPDQEFWSTVLQEPGLLASGPVVGAVVIAAAATAIGRYALGCDLEITQSLAEYWDRKKATLLAGTGLALAFLCALVMVTGKPYGGRGRLVEVGAPGALIDAMNQRSAAERPKL